MVPNQQERWFMGRLCADELKRFELGQLLIEVLETPGHTDDHMPMFPL